MGGRCPGLDAGWASKLVSLSLACVDREYPNKPGGVVDGDETIRPPRETTPAFFGCFDWHSAVHGHWAMVRLVRLFPDLPEAPRIREALTRHLAPEVMERELAYMSAPRNRTFERPYGWGWFLRLAAELAQTQGGEARAWEAAAAPLARFLAGRSADYLGRLSRPVREGTHANTAFSMVHMFDYALAAGDKELEDAVREAALRFFREDRDCPAAYEPSGEDFISPCLAEADVMRRVLPAREFGEWLARFLPATDSPRFAQLRSLPEVRDPSDPKIGHLIGLGFHRAWTFAGIAGTFEPGAAQRGTFEALSAQHCGESLDLMFRSGYGGEHWLATFATYHITR